MRKTEKIEIDTEALQYTHVNLVSPTRVIVSVFSSNNVRITPKRNWDWMKI